MVGRYALREGAALLLGVPLALVGLVLHGPPYQLTRAVVRIGHPTGDAEATYKLTAGVVLYPLCWLVEGWVAGRLGGGWLALLFGVALLPAGFVALTWWERLDRVRRDAREFARFLLHRDLRGRLVARRRALARRLAALAGSVPEAVLSAESRPPA